MSSLRIVFHVFATLAIVASPDLALASSVVEPLPASASADVLSDTYANNEKHIRILQDQIDAYSEYLASQGKSLKISVIRHSDSEPEYFVILGQVSLAGLGAVGILRALYARLNGAKISDVIFDTVGKRFALAGAAAIIITSAGSFVVRQFYTNDEKVKAQAEIVRQLDANPDENMQNTIHVLMVQQMIELKNQNTKIAHGSRINSTLLSSQNLPTSAR